ncbi:MAG TPA: hypothetical protein VFT98_19575 [Myxococcota bacterium]|nr:hypothetical protein [Myxococcota bacterium]
MRSRTTRIALGIASLVAWASCSEPARVPNPAPGDVAPIAGRREVRATIVRASVRIAESFPPQYFADITSALEDGCARFSRTALRREGDTVSVDVFNTRPARDDVMCTMIYGEKETAVALGSDFTPGVTYTLDVNGTRETFVAE